MIVKKPGSDAWEQMEWIWHILSYAFLVMTVVLALGDEGSYPTPSVFLGASIGLALWYVPFIVTPLRWWHDHPWGTLLYFGLAWGLWALLMLQYDGALLLMGLFFPAVFIRFRVAWAIAAASIQTVLLLVVFMIANSAEVNGTTIILAIGLLIAAIILGLFISAVINQNVERKRLLDELTETRASLLRVERETGMLVERQRLARDIHDTLAQQFTSIIMHLAAARLGKADAVHTHIEQAEQAARDGLEESRRIIWDQTPPQLENTSFVEAVEAELARWATDTQISIEMIVTGEPNQQDKKVETALLRIVQEALHNIKKHAQANAVTITLSYMPDMLVLDVADDGVGFALEHQERQGFGLISMQERAKGIDGTMTTESEPGQGVTIAVSVPLKENE
jgi:signal transduction histidine kinase